MKEETKSGYVAGVISLIISLIFITVAINSGWNLAGQGLVIFGLVFGILGIGSIWKPETVGPVASQILEIIARNTNTEEQTQTYKQSQQRSKNSPQGYTEKGNVIINQEFGGQKPRGSKKRD